MEGELLDALRRAHEAGSPGSRDRHYRFEENFLVPPGQFLVMNPRALDGAFPWRTSVGRQRDDLVVLFHPEVPDEVLGRVVNAIRGRGDRVEVERGRRPDGGDDRI